MTWVCLIREWDPGINPIHSDTVLYIQQLCYWNPWRVVSLRQQLVSKLFMNAADNGIIAAKKNHNQFHCGNCMTLTTSLFVFGKIGAQEQHVYSTASLIRDLSLENASWQKGALWLAGGIISSKLEAFCVKHLLPPPEKERSLSWLSTHYMVMNLALCVFQPLYCW